MAKRSKVTPARQTLPKALTGIGGLDEVTGGGLPRGRPTLICGGPGCGKTLLAMEFLVRGATELGEPGVFMSFEETARELTENVRSLGFDLDKLIRQKKLWIDFVRIERQEIEETGEYDLEGLFVRLAYAIDSIGAKRVALDSLEAVFSGLTNQGLLRAELRRLLHWLKDKGVTAVITGERGDKGLTRHGLEEYVSDCVILLDHRVIDQVSTRRLRIVKYRGTQHGTNEYPFIMSADGITVIPITSLGLQHKASSERITSGIPQLDTMLGGKGFFRGSTVLVSGPAGTGKTTIAGSFAVATCRLGRRCLYLTMEESPGQLTRNLRSVGLNLTPWIQKDLLRIHAERPTAHGLERHLATVHSEVEAFQPHSVIIDPISSFSALGTTRDNTAMLTRLVDFLKVQEITLLMTYLSPGRTSEQADAGVSAVQTDAGVSSVVDTWLLLRDVELEGERSRALYVRKSRGMAHSNQIRELVLSARGLELLDAPESVLSGGSARLAQDGKTRARDALPRGTRNAAERGR